MLDDNGKILDDVIVTCLDEETFWVSTLYGPKFVPLLEKYSLPTETDIPDEKLRELIRHDKKSDSGIIRAVWSEHIGECEIREIDFQRI